MFDGDATNRPFSKVLCDANQELQGVVAEPLGFSDPEKGDFTPSSMSVLRNKGLVFTLEADKDLPPGQPPWSNWPRGGKPHIGAVQETGNEISLPYFPMPIR